MKDVEPGATVKIYDKDGNVIGTGTNPGPGKGPVVITVPGLKEGDVIQLTNTEPGKKESTKTGKTVTKGQETSKPIDPNNVTADPDKDEVTVKDVEPGATVKIYDKDGNVIGTGTNLGPGKGPVVITVPGLKEGDVIQLTNTEPGKKESTKTGKTVTKGQETSKPIDPVNVTADPDKDEVTVKDVEPGATVKIYDKDGTVIGTGTNPGPGKGPVVITVPGLKEGDVIQLTNTEPGKKESTMTGKTVTKGQETSKPIDPNNVTADPDTGKVTVKDVEPGTIVKIYDKDGTVIGTGTNPGPGKGPVVITVAGLKEGDVIKLTGTEPGKKESEPTKVIIPNKTLYDVETVWRDKTMIVTVKPKPGIIPSINRAYVVFQGMRADTPVFTTGFAIDGKNPQPFEMKLDQRAQTGDRVYIVIVNQPEYVRSDVGLSLSEEKIEIVTSGGK